VEMQISSYKERSNRFPRNAASGHISIPVCTHINTCFLVSNNQKPLLLIQSADVKEKTTCISELDGLITAELL
jgi:hypothetical protein